MDKPSLYPPRSDGPWHRSLYLPPKKGPILDQRWTWVGLTGPDAALCHRGRWCISHPVRPETRCPDPRDSGICGPLNICMKKSRGGGIWGCRQRVHGVSGKVTPSLPRRFDGSDAQRPRTSSSPEVSHRSDSTRSLGGETGAAKA